MDDNSNRALAAPRELTFDAQQWQMIRDTLANGASEQEFAPLMEMAKARRLNPLLRQIHFVKRWDAGKHREVWSVQVSIDGLRAIAERTGLYAGQDEPEFVDGPEGPAGLPVCCKVRVYRKDWTRPAVGLAYWTEAVQVTRDKATGSERPNAMWKRMPRLMLAKVAEALAIRKAFPEDTSGLYTGDEIASAEERAEGPKPLPPLEVLGIEQAPATLPAPAEPPPSQREVLAMAEALSSAATVEALEALRAEYRPEYNRATAQQQDLLRAAYRARLHELDPPTPPDGTTGPRRGPGPVAPAEGSARASGGAGGAPAASVASLVPEWATTAEGMREHLADKTCRAAVERSVRLHGKRLGRAYVEAAAERVVALDAPGEEGLRLSLVGAVQIVERWAHEGPVARRAGGVR